MPPGRDLHDPNLSPARRPRSKLRFHEFCCAAKILCLKSERSFRVVMSKGPKSGSRRVWFPGVGGCRVSDFDLRISQIRTWPQISPEKKSRSASDSVV